MCHAQNCSGKGDAHWSTTGPKSLPLASSIDTSYISFISEQSVLAPHMAWTSTLIVSKDCAQRQPQLQTTHVSWWAGTGLERRPQTCKWSLNHVGSGAISWLDHNKYHSLDGLPTIISWQSSHLIKIRAKHPSMCVFRPVAINMLLANMVSEWWHNVMLIPSVLCISWSNPRWWRKS